MSFLLIITTLLSTLKQLWKGKPMLCVSMIFSDLDFFFFNSSFYLACPINAFECIDFEQLSNQLNKILRIWSTAGMHGSYRLTCTKVEHLDFTELYHTTFRQCSAKETVMVLNMIIIERGTRFHIRTHQVLSCGCVMIQRWL